MVMSWTSLLGPDVETGNMICAVGLHSLLRDKLASKIADDEEDANFCGKRIYYIANIYRYILPYLPKTWYWVTDLHESWRIWLFLLCSFQSNIEEGSGGVYLDLSPTQLHNGTLWLFSTWGNYGPRDWIISKYWFDKLCLNWILFQLCMNQIG